MDPRNEEEINMVAKLYTCTQCEKRFNTKSDLNSHQRTNTGEKPYKCAPCGKCFSIKLYLNSHQIIHASPTNVLVVGSAFPFNLV